MQPHATASPPSFTNPQIAGRLRRIARDGAALHYGYYRVRAFYQAARIVERLPYSLHEEIRAGIDVTRHPCIGRKISRVLGVMVKGEDFGQLEFPLIYGPAPAAA